jgi:hypothetical protein
MQTIAVSTDPRNRHYPTGAPNALIRKVVAAKITIAPAAAAMAILVTYFCEKILVNVFYR